MLEDKVQLLNKHRYIAPKGNQYWKARKSHGKEKIFESPESLWDLACEYFQWCEDNPLYKPVYFRYRRKIIEARVAKLRCLSIRGLCIHLGISRQTFLNYSSKDAYRDYFAVCERISTIIFVQQYEGAAAGLLNPRVIARELSMRTTQC